MANMQTIEGLITAVLFTSDENFAIIKVTDDVGNTMTCLGNIASPQKGFRIRVSGKLFTSRKYNEEQLKVEEYTLLGVSNTQMAIAKFLADTIKGIGEKKALKIAMEYNTKVADLFSDPVTVEKAKIGLKGPKAYSACTQFEENKTRYDLYVVTNGKITANQCKRVLAKYGENSAKMIKNNPYILTMIDGLAFKKADAIAKGMNIACDADVRVSAGVEYILSEAEKKGHAFLSFTQLFTATSELLFAQSDLMSVFYNDVLKTSVPQDISVWNALTLSKLSDKQVSNLINGKVDFDRKKLTTEEIASIDTLISKRNRLKENIRNVVTQDAIIFENSNIKEIVDSKENFVIETVANQEAVYRRTTFIAEYETAEMLAELAKAEPVGTYDDVAIQRVIKKIEEEDSLADGAPRYFNQEQKEAVKKGLRNRISVITGGPGRGKTTILRAICEIWKGDMVLLAPTGKASKKMSIDTKRIAQTAQRFLVKRFDKNKFETIEPEIPENACVIMDESSMCDLFLIQRLLKLGREKNYHFILVGDIHQLPSIGLGAVLESIIKSGMIPVVELIKCYRNGGTILHNIDVINAGGSISEFEYDVHCRAFLFEEQLKFSSLANIFIKKVKKYGINDTIILVPMRKGPFGVYNINTSIQTIINPHATNKAEVKTPIYNLRVGDRVINNTNNYTLEGIDQNGNDVIGVFNGDTGVIDRIETDMMGEPTIYVKLDDGSTMKFDQGDGENPTYYSLELAYAITIHKSQGSEYKAVILYMNTDAYILLSRKLLYTGASRAKNSLTMLGNPKAYMMAINNAVVEKRQTRLEYRIRRGMLGQAA